MRTSNGSVTYLTGDHQGTAQVAIDAATLASTVRRFTPFGSIRGMDEDATWPNDKGFVGGTQDPTGLTHLGAREYDPEAGRFISVDPVLDPADPQQMNGYAYANNNPVTHADPDGQCPPDICGKGVMNVGHSKPAKHGGCGRDCWGPPRKFLSSPNKPVTFRWGDTDVRARNSIAYVAGVQRMLRYVYMKYAGTGGPLDPELMPACASDGTACFPGDLGRIGNFGQLLCKMSGFSCKRMSGGEFFSYGMNNFVELGGFGFGRDGGGSSPAGAGAGGQGKGAGGKRSKGCSSFVPGTTVLMANGEKKPIEDVKVGDKVLATDPETGETTAQPVLGTITSKGDKHLVQITVDRHVAFAPLKSEDRGSGKAHIDKSGVVIATDAHPFWAAGDIGAWVKAADLKPGMWLRTSASTYVQVTALKHWSIRHQRVHNLTIDRLQTYHVNVGSTPVLVHNDRCDFTDVGTPSDVIVIGNREDTDAYLNEPGHLVLKVPDPDWSLARNLAWIRRGAAARRTYRLVSPLNRENLWDNGRGEPRVYAEEIAELRNQGYRLSPDHRFMLPPP
ncbi:hypothetical protein E1264_33030 [Actinomadura sp. KC216]|uniref:RHS repeat-associated core domain-containing protein n=1 Tax=Actinomadura sp. KC216 TaxID=2530370 RepID=UPI00104FDF2A|nr:RHS repeat-associated core domain-containing protein [Actinomadura sp. KC216]TDB81223.1 hypothetical protein E1264_33030 [Actinomadura sp. KC216]